MSRDDFEAELEGLFEMFNVSPRYAAPLMELLDSLDILDHLEENTNE